MKISKRKKLAGVLGYHYKFANFASDEKILKSNFRIQLTSDPKAVISFILSKRADIGVVTLSYLNRFLNNHPAAKEQIMISDINEQDYLHTILVRKNFEPSAARMNELLEALESSGKLEELFKKIKIL